MQGAAKVVADDLRATEPPPEEVRKDEFYEIVSGDTLVVMARNYYDKAFACMKIFAANRDINSDPNKFDPGQKIRIPID